MSVVFVSTSAPTVSSSSLPLVTVHSECFTHACRHAFYVHTIYIYVHKHIHIRVHAYTHTHTHPDMCRPNLLYVFVHVYVCVCVCTCRHMYTFMFSHAGGCPCLVLWDGLLWVGWGGAGGCVLVVDVLTSNPKQHSCDLWQPETQNLRYVIIIWVVFYIRIRFGFLFIRVPYYFGDLEGDPNLENYHIPVF